MFITEEDYKIMIGEAALKIVTQADPANRTNAEATAIEEMAAYLRPKFDTNAIFASRGEVRNRLLVMYACDIALFHMVAAMPQKMGFDIREERYKLAIKWLEGVQAGKVVPDLPRPGTDAATDGSAAADGAILYHSQPQLRHNW